MKTIYLIRHGQASFGQANYDQLSSLGFEQSALLGLSLLEKNKNYDRVEQGSLVRHQQTLKQALADTYPIVISKNWNEFDHRDVTAHYLAKNGMTSDDFLQLNDADKLSHFSKAVLLWTKKTDESLDYNESWSDFNARVMSALEETIANTKKSALVFTSGGAISAIVGNVMQLTSMQVLTLNLQLVNTGVTKLLVSSRGINVSTINEYVHLEQQHNNKFITYK